MIFDCVIIGAGVSGMTASIYLKRANLNVLLLEKSNPGGQIVKSSIVENYPGFKSIDGTTLAMNIFDQVKSLDIDYRYGNVLSISNEFDYKLVKTDKEVYKTKKVIIATGRIPRKLGLEHEDELVGRGISYCATCDGMLYKDKEVAVIGGGNTALEESLFLAKICKKVTVILRGNSFRGDSLLVERLKSLDNVDIKYNCVVDTLNIENNKIFSINIKENGIIHLLNIAGLFVFIGYVPSIDFIDGLETIDGYIVTNNKMETNIDGIYASGDMIKKDVYQLTTATSEGTIAAISVKNSIIND